MTDATTTAGAAEPSEAPRKLPCWRRALVAILVIVSVVLVPLAGLSVWVRNLVLDTNQVRRHGRAAGKEQGHHRRGRQACRPTDCSKRSTSKRRRRTPSRRERNSSPAPSARACRPSRTRRRHAPSRPSSSRPCGRTPTGAPTTAVVKALTGEGKDVSIKNDKVVLDLSADNRRGRQEARRTRRHGLRQPRPRSRRTSRSSCSTPAAREGPERRAPARPGAHRARRARVRAARSRARSSRATGRRTLMRWGIGIVVAMASPPFCSRSADPPISAWRRITTRPRPRSTYSSGILRNGIRVIAVLGHHRRPRRLPLRTVTARGADSSRARRVLSGGPGARPTRRAGRRARSASGSAAHKVALRVAGVASWRSWCSSSGAARARSRLLVLVLLLLVYLAAIEFVGRTVAVADETPTRDSS